MWLMVLGATLLGLLFVVLQLPRQTVIYYLNIIAFGFAIQFGFLLPLFLFPFRPFDTRNSKPVNWFILTIERLLGYSYNLKGAENIQAGGGVVIINHQSFWDLVVLGTIWNKLGPASIIAKKELIFYPPVGPSIWSYGTVFVDRSNRQRALESLEKASRAINTDGKKLVFFPEGTRSIGDELKPFKLGAFATAFDNKCPVTPVVVPRFTFIDHAKKLVRPCRKTMTVLEPVDSTKFDDAKALRDHCQQLMQKEYERLNVLEGK